MALRRKRMYTDRLEYKKSGNDSLEIPDGNFFAGMSLRFNVDINIATANAADILPQQIARMVEEFRIIRDQNEIAWQISGENLARIFKKRMGVEAAGNTGLTVNTGNNKVGTLYLDVPFHPIDAPKPHDFLMDTRHHKYKLYVKYRDLTAQGTLYGDLSGGAVITANTSNCYIDVTLNKVDPIKGPKGNQDALDSGVIPYFPDLLERTNEVNQTKPDFRIDLPENQILRTIFLFANYEVSADYIAGDSAILTDYVELKDTQGTSYQKVKATDLREDTSVKMRDASLEAGWYEFALTEFGHIVDSMPSDSLRPLYLEQAVKPNAGGTTRIVSITQTVFQQGQ